MLFNVSPVVDFILFNDHFLADVFFSSSIVCTSLPSISRMGMGVLNRSWKANFASDTSVLSLANKSSPLNRNCSRSGSSGNYVGLQSLRYD